MKEEVQTQGERILIEILVLKKIIKRDEIKKLQKCFNPDFKIKIL